MAPVSEDKESDYISDKQDHASHKVIKNRHTARANHKRSCYLRKLSHEHGRLRREGVKVGVQNDFNLTYISDISIISILWGETVSQDVYDTARLHDLVPASASSGITASTILGHDEHVTYSARAQMLINNSTALVTGAGGSIGSELVRQLTALGAQKIICVDRDEYALYRLQLGLTGQAMLVDEATILADVASGPQIESIIAYHRPQLIFHAAACKQLPLLERAPAQAILTNVQGTINVASLAAKYGASYLVNISTDKAARPVSVLGMTKRIAEMATAHYARGGNTLAASVRFGNVFASRGSFIETLAHQVAAGLPVTITDPDMTRFFMTIPEAVSLVIEAAVMADNESIFTLDMGEPHNIVNIARRYAFLVGANDLTITCSGQRPGEKIAEELIAPEEMCHPTDHPAITSIPVHPGDLIYRAAIQGLVDAAKGGANPELLYRTLAEVSGASSAVEKEKCSAHS